MNRVLSVYTEIQTLYDTRRGLLQWLMTEGIQNDDSLRVREGDRLWGLHMAKNYAERRMDSFEFPQLGINRQRFDKLRENPQLEHWLMFYPTNATKFLFRKVLELEQLNEKPIDIKGIKLFVNTFPYVFDKEMQDAFLEQCAKLFGFRFEVKLIHVDVSKEDALFYRPYNYVFKYDLLAETNKRFQETVGLHAMPDVGFVIPDILVRECDNFTGSVNDRIFAFTLTLAAVVKMVPIQHWFYDSIE